MALDDLFKASERYQTIEGIARDSRRDPTNPETIKRLLIYGGRVGERDLDTALTTTIEERRNDIGEFMRADGDVLYTQVKDNYDDVLGNLDDKALLDVALMIPSKNRDDELSKLHKQFLEFENRLSQGDTSFYLEALKQANPVAFNFARRKGRISKDYLEDGANELVNGLKNQFLIQFHEGESLKTDELRKYVRDNAAEYTGDEQKAVYIEIGKRVKRPE